MPNGLEEQLVARQKEISAVYSDIGAQLGVPPAEVQPKPTEIPRLSCLNEIKKIEQDFNNGVTPMQVQTNLHRRFLEYDDPCWDCAWDYFQARQKTLSTGNTYDSVLKFDPDALSNADMVQDVVKATAHELEAAKERLQDLRHSCGIETKPVQDLITDAIIANSTSQFKKFEQIRFKLEDAWRTAISKVLPELPQVMHPISIAKGDFALELTPEEIEIEQEKILQEQHLLNDAQYIRLYNTLISINQQTSPAEFEQARQALRKYLRDRKSLVEERCTVCGNMIAVNVIDEHLREQHAKYKPAKKTVVYPTRIRPVTKFVEEFPSVSLEYAPVPVPVKEEAIMSGIPAGVTIGKLKNINPRELGEMLLGMPTSEAKAAFSVLDEETQNAIGDYLEKTYHTNFGWLFEE